MRAGSTASSRPFVSLRGPYALKLAALHATAWIRLPVLGRPHFFEKVQPALPNPSSEAQTRQSLMNQKTSTLGLCSVTALLLQASLLLGVPSRAATLGPAFTYQGRLD